MLLVRTRATLDRWKEELVIEEEECRRLVRGFDMWSELWHKASEIELSNGKRSDVAFCSCKSAVFADMANYVRINFRDLIHDDKPVWGSPRRRRKRNVEEVEE